MTDPAIPSLISRLEAASGPDREIDALIEAVCYDGPASIVCDSDNAERGHYWVSIDGGRALFSSDPVTASLDAITALIERALPGCSPGVGQNLHHKHWHARLSELDAEGGPLTLGEADAPTPALALCLALVRAIAAQEKQEE